MKPRLPAPVVAGIAVTLLVVGSVIFLSPGIREHLFFHHLAAEAFEKSRWGMTPAEVESVNDTQLKVPADPNRYYTPQPGLEARYKALIQNDVNFLGRLVDVHYVFFDDKLYAYHVRVKDRDAAVLDRDVKAYLVKRFGPVTSEVSDGTPLKRIWHFRDIIVNYWFLQNPLSLTASYEAVFGVVFQPLERSIQAS